MTFVPMLPTMEMASAGTRRGAAPLAVRPLNVVDP